MGNETVDSQFKLVGFQKFVRHNHNTDRFRVIRFHHVEFWCSNATNTAPYSPSIAAGDADKISASLPTFDHAASRAFTASHGLAVRSIAIEVEDAEVAFNTSVAHGAKPASAPVVLQNLAVIAEVHLYGDAVLRNVSYKDKTNPELLSGFEPMDEISSFPLDYGIRRLDHAVGNVPELIPAVSYVKSFTGFHEFAEFTAEDVGTTESGLNSMVLANNNERVAGR